MKEYLKTMRQQGMQQQMQVPPEKEKTDHKDHKTKTYGDDGLELYGNEDAKTLSKIYKVLSKNGLTVEEKNALKTFDEALKGAELIAPSDDVTLIVQDRDTQKETVFVVLGNDHKQNSGFINSQSKPKGLQKD